MKEPKQRRRLMILRAGPCHGQVLNVFLDDLDEVITFNAGTIRYVRQGDRYVYSVDGDD